MKKKGRPTRDPTDAEREKVVELVGLDAPLADIAIALKRSVPNVRKYFSAQLNLRKKKAPVSDFKATALDREKVIRYIGCRMTVEDVARVIGVTPDELKEHFADEIVTGRAKYRAKVLDNLDSQMDDGTVGATNRLEALTVIPDPSDKEPGADRIGPNLGKKAAGAASAAAAASGGGMFSPPSAPKLVVNNDSGK